MKIEDINYSSLGQMQGLWFRKLHETLKIHPYIAIGALIAILAAASILVRHPFPLYILILIGIIYYRKSRAYREPIWREFAEANGWKYTLADAAALYYVPPALISVGNGQKLGDVVHADINGHKCDIYKYEFSTGSGKSKQFHFYTIVCVTVARSFPHLVLDSKRSRSLFNPDAAFVGSVVPPNKAKLEGNFHDYFQLYYEKGENIDALSVITPDVMQTLIDSNQAQDIEVSGKHIYFMAHSDQRTASELPALLNSVDVLANEIGHKAKTIQYKTAVPDHAVLTQAANKHFKNKETRRNITYAIMFAVGMIGFIVYVVISGF